MDCGRLGLLSILFEFIDDGRRVWTVGGGRNVYQFIYAKDLANACILALDYPGSEVFNIGSDDVKSFAEVYEYVIKTSGSKSRLGSLPRTPAIAAQAQTKVPRQILPRANVDARSRPARCRRQAATPVLQVAPAPRSRTRWLARAGSRRCSHAPRNQPSDGVDDGDEYGGDERCGQERSPNLHGLAVI